MTKQKNPELEKTRQLRLRFGFRLKTIFWPLDNLEIGQILDKTGYKDIQMEAGGAIRGSKNNTDFYYDRVKMVFGFYANTTDGLISAQKEFFASSQKDFLVNLNNFIRFYEIENAISYRLEKPNNTVAGIFSDSSDMNQINHIIEEETVLSKLEVGKANASVYDDDLFSVEVSPKTESAGNAYVCRIVKRSKNIDEVVKTLRKSHTILEEMAKFAEKRNQN